MGTFKPGISGNPKGKKAGTLNKRTELAKCFEVYSEALISKTIELALSGDTVALRLCVERLVPKVTDKPVTVLMPDLNGLATIKIIPELLRSLAGQELSISDMKSLLDIFSSHDNEVENNNPIPLKITSTDPIEAAKAYQRFMLRGK